MRSMIPFLAAGISLLANTATALYWIPLPKGNGFFLIYAADNDQEPIGCLAEDGKWTNGEVTACGIPYSDGEGYVEGFDGYLKVNSNRVITTAKDEADASDWGSSANVDLTVSLISKALPAMILADGGQYLDFGGGGPFWYAAAAPSGAETVELNAVPMDGDQVQNVTLSWLDYDRYKAWSASNDAGEE
ncbi:hypothetical protein AtubIFM56815_001386 [Aspergillus tubingensis]|uniref:Uncharacterized protein n=1 Tax=Aspergillus tubingensis TaxID=5068 RepID=A0A9W6EG44_ASPTU|nr:hypothetical protein AtubIFM56815_001386 [Aspergillus tubingensis]